MSDYKRIVSYMYNYEYGMKKNSVGFARIESRNGQCKITINIKAISFNQSSLKAYIFRREDEKIVPVPLGTVQMKNGNCEFRVFTQTEHIMNTENSLDKMGGIIVYYNSDKFFGTEWDDKPIYIHPGFEREEATTVPKAEKSQNKLPAAPANVSKQKEEVVIEKINPKEIKDAEVLKPEAEVNNLGNQMIQAAVKETKPEIVLEAADTAGKEEGETEGREHEVIQTEELLMEERRLCQSAQRIFSRYPKMEPFDDEEIEECVKIEPQDIGMFPMENWVLGNNSFLLHGYYNYRHLIFARRKGYINNQYIIGVPGIYQNREKFMAKMFGFEQFKCVKNVSQKTGEFGYWYMPVKM